MGSQRSHTPNTRISTIDETNSGITVADKPAMLMVRSSQRPACMADHTPPAMPSGTTTINASRPSLAECARASAINGATGSRYA